MLAKIPILILILFAGPNPSVQDDAVVVNEVLAAKKCENADFSPTDQRIVCRFVLPDLEFSVDWGAHPSYVTIHEKKRDGRYEIDIDADSGCVIVKAGRTHPTHPVRWAFVSPWDGRVYRKITDCDKARPRSR